MIWPIVIFVLGFFAIPSIIGLVEQTHINAYNRIHYKNSVVKTLWRDDCYLIYKRGEIGHTKGEFKKDGDEEYVKVYFDEYRELYVPIKRLKWVSYIDETHKWVSIDETHIDKNIEKVKDERKDNIQKQER